MRIVAESPEHILEGIVRDDADLDGEFEMFTDDGETLVLRGWLWIIETLDRQGEDHVPSQDNVASGAGRNASEH
jgi:hypothetical protein